MFNVFILTLYCKKKWYFSFRCDEQTDTGPPANQSANIILGRTIQPILGRPKKVGQPPEGVDFELTSFLRPFGRPKIIGRRYFRTNICLLPAGKMFWQILGRPKKVGQSPEGVDFELTSFLRPSKRPKLWLSARPRNSSADFGRPIGRGHDLGSNSPLLIGWKVHQVSC